MEKGEIRIKLSTVCIVSIIVVGLIVGLLIYIDNIKKNCEVGKTEVAVEESKEKEAEETEEPIEETEQIDYLSIYDEIERQYPGYVFVATEDGSISKEKKSTQMEGTFYPISGIARETRDNYDVKNYKDFQYDIDGDGESDLIRLKHIIDENEDEYSSRRDYYSLVCNDKVVYEHWAGMGSVGIVDLDKTDNMLEIWVYDDGFSDDPVYHFYRKVGTKIVELGEFNVENGFITDGKGRIAAAGREMPDIYPGIYRYYYTIEDNKFVEHELDFSYNKDFEYSIISGYFTEDIANLENYKKALNNSYDENIINHPETYNITKIDSTTKFKIDSFVEDEWVLDLKVTLSDGTEGYLIHPYGRFEFYD